MLAQAWNTNILQKLNMKSFVVLQCVSLWKYPCVHPRKTDEIEISVLLFQRRTRMRATQSFYLQPFTVPEIYLILATVQPRCS